VRGMNFKSADYSGPSNSLPTYSTVIVGGVRTACISRGGLATLMISDCITARAQPGRPKLIFDTNGHGLSLAAIDPGYHKCLEAADLIHADGQVIVTASRILTSSPIPERSATTDFFHDAAKAASQAGLRIFLFGGTEEVNRECADIVQDQYPSLKIAGRRHGYFSDADEATICDAINASGADVVWVGLGKPKEQAFCVRNRHLIKAGWLITCGGCFNFIAGRYSRAPNWMQNAGLEWLHRMVTNPRQLFWRYLTTNPHALFLIATRTSSGADTR
jgi:N-acetylglucosaminyldiphosphoundecaprenol N-acetyl-beta-D-mannosaminyltransferase